MTQEEWVKRFGAQCIAGLSLCYIKKGDKLKSQEMLKELQINYPEDLENKEVLNFISLLNKMNCLLFRYRHM